MTRPVTIQHRSSTVGFDEYDNPIPGTDTITYTVGYLEQTEAVEVSVGQDTFTSADLLVLPPLTVIDGSDRVVIGGTTYEVIGDPARPWRPSTGEHHVECRLRTTAEAV